MESQNCALATIPNNPIDNLTPAAKNFYQFHGIQMLGSQFPTSLIETLYLKLTDSAYDGGEFFEILDNEDEETYEVRATQHIPANGNVFVIDHALTFRYPQLRTKLRENDTLVDRLEKMLKYHQEQKKLPGFVAEDKSTQGSELELESMDLLQVGTLELPKTLITLSLMNNRLQNAEELISKLQYLSLKVLWLNGNPVATSQVLNNYVEKKTRIQIFNSKFTKNCTEWGLKYAHSKSIHFADNTDKSEVYVLNLDGRNIFNIDIEILEKFRSLRSISLKNHSFENQQEWKKLYRIIGIRTLNFLFLDEAVEKGLRERVKKEQLPNQIINNLLVNKHSLKLPLAEGDARIDSICSSIFRLAGCYRLASPEKLDESSCWYINDELGSYISHSDQPKVKIIPFLYAPHSKLDKDVVAYSLLWPLEDIQVGDLITKDYLSGLKEERQRSSRLAAWFQLPKTYYLKQVQQFNSKMFDLSKNSISLLEKFYGLNALKQRESAGKIQKYQEKLNVITDYEYINKFLKHQRFQLVSQLEKANIVWLVAAAEQAQWNKYKGKYFLNQFPFESCIVLKHNLANTIQSVFGDTKFLMRTYDLEKELALFVGDFYKRQKEGEDNLWILKPPNMARSMDMIITDDLSLVVRAMETGPKIAQKYIHKPVLRRGRKVDLRYILLVKSISPLTLFLYKNFWIRSANNQYTVDRRDLSTYQTQFTVMNYGNVSNFQQIKYKDFIEEFEKDYKVGWSTINDKIKKMLRNVFISVSTKYPEMHDDKSRAVYGIDIMIDAETMEPKLLEITFSPDCKRACDYYPTFYDEIFQTLFLETMSENMERII